MSIRFKTCVALQFISVLLYLNGMDPEGEGALLAASIAALAKDQHPVDSGNPRSLSLEPSNWPNYGCKQDCCTDHGTESLKTHPALHSRQDLPFPLHMRKVGKRPPNAKSVLRLWTSGLTTLIVGGVDLIFRGENWHLVRIMGTQ